MSESWVNETKPWTIINKPWRFRMKWATALAWRPP